MTPDFFYCRSLELGSILRKTRVHEIRSFIESSIKINDELFIEFQKIKDSGKIINYDDEMNKTDPIIIPPHLTYIQQRFDNYRQAYSDAYEMAIYEDL